MTIQHAALTDPELHEPKGVAAATADQVYVSDGAASGAWTDVSALPVTQFYPRGHIDGVLLSNGADAVNDISISAGEAVDSTATDIMRNGGALVKQLDSAWAVGTGAGGRDAGSIADGWWHVYLIKRSDTGVVDALFSTNASTPTMPANYDLYRRIGSVLRDAGSLVAFSQVEDEFLWETAILDVDTNNPGTSAVLAVLSVPTGVIVRAFGNAYLSSTATDSLGLITSPSQADVAPSETVAPLADLRADASSDTADIAHMECRTDTSGRIRYRLSFSAATTDIRIVTEGWFDRRGKDN